MTILLAAVMLATPAHAGNERGNLFGTEAALSAGALVATTRAAEATWYNPAGLGDADRTRLNVNLSAFVLRVRQSDVLVTTRIGDTNISTPADATQLVSVPSSLSVVRRVSPKTTIGLGVYVTGAERFNLIASSQTQVDEPWDTAVYTQSLQELSEAQQFHVGLSVGTAVSERLRLGGSIMGVYDRYVGASSFLADLAGTQGGERRRATLDVSGSDTHNTLGVRAVVGLQWEFLPHWHLGAVARTPALGFYRWGKMSTSEIATIDPSPEGRPPTSFNYQDDSNDEAQAVQIDPMKLSLSFGVIYPRFTLGLEGEVAFGVLQDAVGRERRAYGNVALGGRFQASERVWIGAGVFTDMSPLAEVEILESGLDYYGLTLGPELRNPVRARGREDGVVFTTSLGLRYAIGVGPFGGLNFDGSAAMQQIDLGAQITSQERRVTFHEVSVLIGSAVAF